MTTKTTTSHPNGHDPHGRADGAGREAECPYCGQAISRKEYREIQARIADEERARIGDVEKALHEKFAREREQAEAKKVSEIDKAKKDAARATEQTVKALKATLETTTAERVAAQREASEKKLAEAVAAERTRAYGDRMKLDAQLADLQRRLQRRTAAELGDEGEIDMFEALTGAFPGDDISRVAKGVAGADIVHRIVHNGTVAGTVIYDCKNHKRWQNHFTLKLREDQLTAQADHAVLVATTFPAGEHQLLVKDGVIVAAPPRVVAIAHLLRRQVVLTYSLKLNSQDRAEKSSRLYLFMTSDRADHLWEQMTQATADMADLDRAETVAHQKTWTRRADLIRGVQAVHDEFSGAIDRIISGNDPEPPL
jgi:hypothetical protein